ncbi:RidA family protein [Acinetobacter rudis]|uniref:RidA family protein n=1 Tax=Acinetobacter rudis TaxID=632955 RepID=UPI003340D7EE
MNNDIQYFQQSARLSGCVVHAGLAYLSGQVPSNLDADMKQQTLEVLAKIDALLEQVGSDKSRILTAQIWIKNIAEDFNVFNECWEAWLPQGYAPARAALQADLARPQVLVEVMLTAALK